MIIKGKEIKAEIITMWLNVFSFIVGIIFYIRLENKYENPTPIIQPSSSTQDSVFYLNTELKYKLAEIKLTQDSLIKEIKNNNELSNVQKKNIAVIRYQLYTTIQSDWDALSREKQNAYIQQVMSNLKIKNHQ